MTGSPLHLARRAVGSVRNGPVGADGLALAASVLLPRELELWARMQNRDQRHSLLVLSRFDSLAPGAPREARAGALLHDVGKVVSGLGWAGRVVATLAGGVTRRFRDYRDHERIGADMLRGISDPVTVALVEGTARGDHAEALRRADDI